MSSFWALKVGQPSVRSAACFKAREKVMKGLKQKSQCDIPQRDRFHAFFTQRAA
jgi:hypothetical protein